MGRRPFFQRAGEVTFSFRAQGATAQSVCDRELVFRLTRTRLPSRVETTKTTNQYQLKWQRQKASPSILNGCNLMSISEVIEPDVVAKGPILLRRFLPTQKRQMVGPFIFFDQAGPTQVRITSQSGFSEHPHSGTATLTYLLNGDVTHRDSAGGYAELSAGDLALMTAGRGVTHEERPQNEAIGTMRDVYFIEAWLALPDSLENIQPQFEHHKHRSLPEVCFDSGLAWVLMGEGWGANAPTTCHSRTVLTDISIEPGGIVPLELDYAELAIFVLQGDASLNDVPLRVCTMSIYKADTAPVLTTTSGCRAIVLGGDAFSSPRFVEQNFVASSEVLLEQQAKRYRNGEFPSLLSSGRDLMLDPAR